MSCEPDFVQMAGKRVEELKNSPLSISSAFVTWHAQLTWDSQGISHSTGILQRERRASEVCHREASPSTRNPAKNSAPLTPRNTNFKLATHTQSLSLFALKLPAIPKRVHHLDGAECRHSKWTLCRDAWVTTIPTQNKTPSAGNEGMCSTSIGGIH